MALQVVQGALLQCSFGVAPAALMVTSQAQVTSGGMSAATIMDFAPMTNIPTFGMCAAPTNPAVIAALGAPVPCVPVTTAPWVPGCPKTTISGIPALNDSSQCLCAYLGVIKVSYAGQATEQIP